ncbi:uncharacterized protein BCR38DRAFT_334341 [Pseudomassariella vexata]|uniref:DUF1770-domain-containing protein n=1 Tax=Pseudomassariella vexata TaxID=1141098 RepID=A0A1Y2EEG4_9PEZI|nr:uncharacterized protein BCR38DRAFT_334341 [Pseudomassariella vexata]ORY69973.1 hypothetical protein BCR38DRAFT_334341 [Pseudomassariella vexata]
MSLPTQLAETVQSAHIKRDPSPHHDLNPSTAASKREPVRLTEKPAGEFFDEIDDASELDDGASEIPVSVLKPRPRHQGFPPMPDLRFEQSYLHSIENAGTWWKVAWITVRDQMMMPLAQGVLWNLTMMGWHHWNRNAQYSGSSVGARIRRWWYGVNNWAIPTKAKSS